jgi:ferredoxin-type protein NapG
MSEDRKNLSPDTPPAAPGPEHDAARRSFFAVSLRKLLSPVALLLERRVEPMANALQGKMPRSGPKHVPIPLSRPPESPVPKVILRPPGALASGEFERTCSQCACCVEVCPVSCIHINPKLQIAGGFPYIVPSVAACTLCEELACMNACPSGALQLESRTEVRIGLAEMNHKTCLRSRGEDCRLCIQACPIGESAIAVNEATGRVIVKSGGCTGCGMCEQACPTAPASIAVKPLKCLDDVTED